MTQFETIKQRLKELEAERNALEIELLNLEKTKIGTQIACFVLGVFFTVSNAAWFALWAWA